MREVANFIVFAIIAYPVGIVIGMSFWLARLFGILKVRGWWENFPHWRTRVVAVSNHPYKGEQWWIAALFFHQYIWRPIKYAPHVMADKRNYREKYKFLQWKIITVDREKRNGDSSSFRTAKGLLERGRSIVCFAEGGRTSKGENFLISPKGNKLRVPLKESFAQLATKQGVILLPVWWEFNSWHDIRVVVGKPLTLDPETSREAVVKIMEQTLLELADQTS